MQSGAGVPPTPIHYYFLPVTLHKSNQRSVKSEEAKSKIDELLIEIRRFWPARRDSNTRPSESESDALSDCATGGLFFLFLRRLNVFAVSVVFWLRV